MGSAEASIATASQCKSPSLHLLLLPHRYCPWKHSPKSLMHPNLRDSESVSQRTWPMTAPFLGAPTSSCSSLFSSQPVPPKTANLVKLCPKSHQHLHDYQSGTESQLTCPLVHLQLGQSPYWSPYFLSWPLRSIPQPNNKGNPVITWLNHIICLLKTLQWLTKKILKMKIKSPKSLSCLQELHAGALCSLCLHLSPPPPLSIPP